jgi:hypothetical protein
LKDVVSFFAPVQERKLGKHPFGQKPQSPTCVLEQLGSSGFIVPAQTLQAPLNPDRRTDPLYTHRLPIAHFNHPAI